MTHNDADRETSAAWTEDRAELLAVARMLSDLEWFAGAADVVDFLEAPWKWAPERDAWIAAGRPTAQDPNWQIFAARIARTE